MARCVGLATFSASRSVAQGAAARHQAGSPGVVQHSAQTYKSDGTERTKHDMGNCKEARRMHTTSANPDGAPTHVHASSYTRRPFSLINSEWPPFAWSWLRVLPQSTKSTSSGCLQDVELRCSAGYHATVCSSRLCLLINHQQGAVSV